MTFTIDITSDLKKLEHYMNNLEKKQLPYAVSLTLNELAVKSQEAICKRIKHVFNNKNNWWDKRQRTGIKVQFSHKYDLVAAVYTKAYFVNIQEEGGVKKPYRGSNLAIPTDNIPKRQRSSNALRTHSSNDIFKKSGSIYKRLNRKQLQRLYSLTPTAHVKARLGFKRTAHKVYTKQFDRIFNSCFKYALDTAK